MTTHCFDVPNSPRNALNTSAVHEFFLRFTLKHLGCMRSLKVFASRKAAPSDDCFKILSISFNRWSWDNGSGGLDTHQLRNGPAPTPYSGSIRPRSNGQNVISKPNLNPVRMDTRRPRTIQAVFARGTEAVDFAGKFISVSDGLELYHEAPARCPKILVMR